MKFTILWNLVITKIQLKDARQMIIKLFYLLEQAIIIFAYCLKHEADFKLGITRSIHKFNILQCSKYGIKCLDKDTFTFCSTSTQFIIIQVDGLKCPYGYMCQEASQYPCILDPEYDFGSNGCITTSTTTPEFITLTEPTKTSPEVTSASETASNTNTEPYEATTMDIQDYSTDNTETKTSTRTSGISTLDFNTSPISEGTTTLLSTSSSSRYDTSNSTYPTSTTNEMLSTSEFSSEKTSVHDKTSNTDNSNSTLTEGTTIKLSSDSETSTISDDTITKTTTGETSTSKFVFTSPEDANEVSIDVVTKTTAGEYSSTVATTDTTKISIDENSVSQSLSTSPKFISTTRGTTISSEDTRTSSISTSSRPTRQPVGPPTCSNYALYPGPTCNQYYECQMYWLFWYTPVLKSCPTGQSFSTTKSLCVPTTESNCID